jgi:hypothetical protein
MNTGNMSVIRRGEGNFEEKEQIQGPDSRLSIDQKRKEPWIRI